MNINRLLENSKRISLIGKNIYTYEGYVDNKEWQPPSPGFVSSFKRYYATYGICIGHQVVDLTEGVYPEFYENGNKLEFEHMRHRWTPAWQETYYRCSPDTTYYPNSGCISFCEKKCITQNDVFYSHIVLQSDKREATEIKVKLVAPHSGEFDFDIQIGALTGDNSINTKGYISVKNTISSDNEFTVSIPANGSVSLAYSFAFSKHDIKTAEKAAKDVLANNNIFTENENNFNRFMSEFAPKLTIDNIDILKIYYYRWFLIYRALHNPSEVIHSHPISRYCFYESPYGGWYGCPVGLPVPLHTEETKWMTDPKFVYSNTLNWIDGICNYQHYIQYTPMAIWHLYLNHPDKELLKKGYNVCYKFAINKFNPENEGLEFFTPTVGSWVTGAEYQPAFYQHRDVKWDWTYDTEGFRAGLATEISQLYRLDDITYSIGNLIGCSKIAKELGKDEDCETLSKLADKAIQVLIKYFWNEERKCFVSIDARTKKQCDEAICYDSFLPYLWGIIGESYYEGFSHLADDEELACTFGITSADKKCPMYWFDNCIAGPTKSSIKEPHPYVCSWNGPVWPYAVSGVLEALGNASIENGELKELWLENFDKYTELHFMEGDRSTPMITEHYRPTDGYSFSRTCDYFHSTWIDLFMKYWAGIKVNEEGVTFSPFTKEEFTISNCIIAGKKYEFTQRNVNGKREQLFRIK